MMMMMMTHAHFDSMNEHNEHSTIFFWGLNPRTKHQSTLQHFTKSDHPTMHRSRHWPMHSVDAWLLFARGWFLLDHQWWTKTHFNKAGFPRYVGECVFFKRIFFWRIYIYIYLYDIYIYVLYIICNNMYIYIFTYWVKFDLSILKIIICWEKSQLLPKLNAVLFQFFLCMDVYQRSACSTDCFCWSPWKTEMECLFCLFLFVLVSQKLFN